MPASSLIPLRRIKTRFRIQISESVWEACEDAMGVGPFNPELREKIWLACAMYRAVGLQYESSNTMPRGAIKKAIQRWLDNTGRLLKLLNSPPTKRQPAHGLDMAEHVVAMLENSKPTKLPTELLASVLQLASAVGINTLVELDKLSVGLEHDFWGIWVALIAKSLEESGLKITAASLNKSTTGTPSPFVQMIICLQPVLPDVCQRRTGVESLVKGINSARRKWKPQSLAGLYYVLAGHGLQARRGEDRISSVDDRDELSLEVQRHVEKLQREAEALGARETPDDDARDEQPSSGA